MKVHIQTLYEGNFSLYVSPSDSIEALKLLILEQKGVPLEEQRLIYTV